MKVEQLLNEQQLDDSLRQCWALARQPKGGYYIKKELLYHAGNVSGQVCEQLCVPQDRRSQVLNLAHEVYGAHLGKVKTRDRIRLSFHWPTLTSDCKRHCMTCEQCQKRVRVTKYDHVPITPIPRAENVFSYWFMNCMGPIFPNQNVRYNYCLLLCDSDSRWPAAYSLHSLTSRAVCVWLSL